MNILMVSSYLPYPLFSGGQVRLYNLIKQLADKHTITLVCEMRSHQTEKDIQELRKYCKEVICIPRKKQWSFSTIIKTGFSLNSFLVTGHTLPEMKKVIESLLKKDQFDLIHAETFYIMQNIPQVILPIVLVEHNIEYFVYQRFADKAPLLLKPFLFLDILKMKRNERHAWKRAAKLVAVSEQEKQEMQRSDVTLVPNGVDLDVFTFKKPQAKEYRSVVKGIHMPEKEMLFIGDFKWMQNVDAAKWLIDDIWPYLLRAVESEYKIKLRIIGRNIPDGIKQRNTFDSIVLEDNSTLSTIEIFHRADILLAPTRIGGGTSYKVIEAMASGTPVVTSRLGIEGIPAEEGKEVMIADDVQTLVEKTARLLRDEEKYSSIAKNARKLVEERYDWKKITKQLEGVYNSVY